ncbi:ethylene-responsive transcription factor ERF014 [Euphorbia lathyris]|uniref:ethylene-responsive transcription factor ERF014 n=1 Tax=Euphorbia lathyris TaxID=212925 RepID=UPI0033136724
MVKSEQKIRSPETSLKAIGSPSSSSSSPPPPSSSSSSKKKYKGVRMRSWGSWVSEIRAPNQKTRIWLGSYSTPEAAARAYDAALLCLKGSSANLNFPITSSHYIPDAVMSPKSIQRVAAAAANSFIDNAASPTTTVETTAATPPTPSPSSSSSMPSSPSDQIETYDDVSLMQPPQFDESFYNIINHDQQSISMLNDSWYTFDQMFINGAPLINPPSTMIVDDFYEGDIRLWSFAE